MHARCVWVSAHACTTHEAAAMACMARTNRASAQCMQARAAQAGPLGRPAQGVGAPAGSGDGSACSTRCASRAKEGDRNGGRPAAHSCSTQPSAQRSLALLCTPPGRKSSGAMYVGVACAPKNGYSKHTVERVSRTCSIVCCFMLFTSAAVPSLRSYSRQEIRLSAMPQLN